MAEKKLTVKVLNMAGEEVRDLKLNPSVFGVEVKEQAMFNAVVVDQANRRQATAKTKTREEEIPIYPDDLTRQQWKTYGSEMENLKENPAITEYNPELRVEEDTAGIQFALNVLAFKSGLGTGYYKFDSGRGTVITATQYVGDRQDLISNANKHRKNVDEFVCGIGRAILLLGRILFKKPVTEDCIVKITDKDGFMVDTETAKQEFRQDIAQGIRQPWEYRVKFYGENEETARKMVADEEIEDIEE